MITHAEVNLCLPSIKQFPEACCARLLIDAFILKVWTGSKSFFSSFLCPPLLFRLLLRQAGFGKRSPHWPTNRPTGRLAVSNEADAVWPTRRRWTKSGIREQAFRVRRCHHPHRRQPASGWLSPCDGVRGNGLFKRHAHYTPPRPDFYSTKNILSSVLVNCVSSRRYWMASSMLTLA